MVSMSPNELAIYKHKRTPIEAIKARIEKANGQLEKELQKDMAQYLGMKGICFFRQRMDRKTSGTVGWPDFTFSINGRACAVEAKVGSNDLDPEQMSVIAKMINNGWKVAVVRDLAQLKAFLDEMEGAASK